MTASITIIKDLSEFARAADAFDDVGQKQLPFAISQAINDALFEARREIVHTTFPKSFDVRDHRFINAAMRVERANKSKLEGSLYDKLGRGHLQVHAEGGTKKARGRLAVPSDDIKRRRGARGVPKRLRPSAFKGRRAIRITRAGIFEGRGGKLHALYIFARVVRIRKEFPFYEDFSRVVTQTMHRNFPKHFANAIRTAR